MIELVLALTIMSLICLIGAHGWRSYLDHLATRDAGRAAAAMIARARDEAVALHAPVSVRIDTTSATIRLSSRTTALAAIPLGWTYGVTLSTTRDSISFDVRGLGTGAANLTLVARRGREADTLVVSRLGRVRD